MDYGREKTHKMLQDISFTNNREENKWIGPVCHNTHQSMKHRSVDNLHSKHAWVV